MHVETWKEKSKNGVGRCCERERFWQSDLEQSYTPDNRRDTRAASLSFTSANITLSDDLLAFLQQQQIQWMWRTSHHLTCQTFFKILHELLKLRMCARNNLKLLPHQSLVIIYCGWALATLVFAGWSVGELHQSLHWNWRYLNGTEELRHLGVLFQGLGCSNEDVAPVCHCVWIYLLTFI